MNEQEIEVKDKYTHVIDWDMVTDFKDLVEIMKALEMKYNPSKCSDKVKKYLVPISG